MSPKIGKFTFTLIFTIIFPLPSLAQSAATVYSVGDSQEQFQIYDPDKPNSIVRVDSLQRREVAVLPGECNLVKLRFPEKERRGHNYININRSEFLIETPGGRTVTPQLTDVRCESGVLSRETPDIFTDEQNRLVINGNRLGLISASAVKVGWWEIRVRSFRLNQCGISPVFTGLRRVADIPVRISELENINASLICRNNQAFVPISPQ